MHTLNLFAGPLAQCPGLVVGRIRDATFSDSKSTLPSVAALSQTGGSSHSSGRERRKSEAAVQYEKDIHGFDDRSREDEVSSDWGSIDAVSPSKQADPRGGGHLGLAKLAQNWQSRALGSVTSGGTGGAARDNKQFRKTFDSDVTAQAACANDVLPMLIGVKVLAVVLVACCIAISVVSGAFTAEVESYGEMLHAHTSTLQASQMFVEAMESATLINDGLRYRRSCVHCIFELNVNGDSMHALMRCSA